MTHDPRNPESGDLPDAFVDSLESYIFGVISIEHMRRRIGSLLSENHDWAPDMLAVIGEAYGKGQLKGKAYRALVEEIDVGTADDDPTEWSEETRAEFEAANWEASNDTHPPVLTRAVKADEPLFQVTDGPAVAGIGPGTLLRDRYLLHEKIGTGSMGDVYRALDRQKEAAGSPEPWVAIKLVSQKFSRSPNALQGLKQEAAHGERLVHPNIIRIFDFDWDGDQYFMTMEWLQGQSLVDVLNERRFQPLPLDQATTIIEGLCHGLAHAHAEGIVHSDVKPGNVFITRAGHTKLLDFGIARVMASAPGDLDATGIGAHTPAYSSCEVLEGAAPEPIDDVYSLGCVAYRLLAGRRAYGGSTALDAEARNVDLKPIPELNESQWRALKGALAWRRINRTPDVATFLADFLSQATVDMTLPMPREPAPEPVEEPTGRPGTPLKYAAPALAVILIAIAAVLWWPEVDQRTAVAISDSTRRAAPEPEPATPPPEPAEIGPAQSDDATVDEAPPDDAPPDEALANEALADEPVVDEALADEAPDEDAGVEKGAQSERPEAAPAPEDPDAERVEALLDAANQRMDDGRLIEPADDSAFALIGELEEIAPDSPELQQSRLRLANLMLLEAMVAITDEDFTRAGEWIEQTRALGVPDAMTARYETQLAEAREAKTERESESLGAIFASATPAAILADPEVSFEAQAAATDAEAGPESATLAMVLPDDTATAPRADGATADTAEPEPEPAMTPLSALEFRRFVEPRHPSGAVARDKEGWVEVRFGVDEKGKTVDVRVVDSEPAGLFEESALTAIRRWRFRPYRVEGQATPTRSGVRLRFQLKD